MLDNQLLMANQKNSSPTRRYHGENNLDKDSLTYRQFHGDKVYLDNGKMAYKPIPVETILETVDEMNETKNMRNKKMSYQAEF